MTTQLVRLKNDFHNSAVTLRCEVLAHIHGEATIRPTATQIKRARKQLCGIAGCTCGSDCGTRGPQEHNGKRLIVDSSDLYVSRNC